MNYRGWTAKHEQDGGAVCTAALGSIDWPILVLLLPFYDCLLMIQKNEGEDVKYKC